MFDIHKTRIIGIQHVEMLSRFDTIPERDGQMDRQTDRQTDYINIALQHADAR